MFLLFILRPLLLVVNLHVYLFLLFSLFTFWLVDNVVNVLAATATATATSTALSASTWRWYVQASTSSSSSTSLSSVLHICSLFCLFSLGVYIERMMIANAEAKAKNKFLGYQHVQSFCCSLYYQSSIINITIIIVVIMLLFLPIADDILTYFCYQQLWCF